MCSRFLPLALCALAAANVAYAEDPAPGLWALSLEAKVDSAPGFEPGPLTVNQCFTKADAADPSKLLGPIASAGAAGCSYSKASYVGQAFHFAMECAGTFELRTTGEVTFTATTLRGLITTSSSIDGKKVEFKSVLSGHRVGDC
jgi:Protein of unknown function (DUF3617)